MQNNTLYKKRLFTWSSILLLSAGTATTSAQQCQTLVWNDEFDGNSVDTSKWEFQIGDGCDIGLCGWGNNELQSYQEANATVANGTLSITAKKQRVKSNQYTSARLRTANMPASGEWTNGRFEARIKTPEGSGLWPAFWMLPTDPAVGWPMSGEIDILESTGQASMLAHGTIHYGSPWPDNAFTGAHILKQPDKWSDDFHVYAVEWDAYEIRWYVDDLLYSTKTPDDLGGHPWPFEDYAYHFLLNLAVGGNWGGTVDDSIFPRTMEVDYVRVYSNGQPSLSGSHIVAPAASAATYRVIDENGSSSSYSWSVPVGASITSGQGSDTITVDWGENNSGEIAVTINNSCGSHNLSLDVFVEPTLSQETVLDNFEDQRNLTYTFHDGSFNPAEANPQIDNVNNSAIVAKYIRNSSIQWDVIATDTVAISDASAFVSGEKAFHLDVYSDAPAGTEILVQLEDSSVATPTNYPNGRHSNYKAVTTEQHSWQQLRFRLADRIDGATADTDINSIIVLLDPDSYNSNTYYLDNFDIYGDGDIVIHPTSMQIQDITTGTQGAGKSKKRGNATIVITDNNGDPVADATVSGSFNGSFTEAAYGTTSVDGSVTLTTTATASGQVAVGFCVDNVTHTELSYDMSANLETCD